MVNLQGSVDLILTNDSVMWVTVPIDLTTRSFIPLPHFLNSRRVSPLLDQSLVLITHDMSHLESFIGLLCNVVSGITFFP